MIASTSTASQKDFAAYCRKVNAMCMDLQECEKEYVPDEVAVRALENVRHMDIETPADALVFCASASLLNTFVKQKGNHVRIGYDFKNLGPRILPAITQGHLAGTRANLTQDRSMSLLMIDVNGVQFSFHCVPTKAIRNMLPEGAHFESFPFDGIRKQKCALSLLNAACNYRHAC